VLERKPRLRFNDLRHTFASILIAPARERGLRLAAAGPCEHEAGADTHAHLIDRHEHAERASGRLEAAFGALIS
jgi:hypothetical protein